MALLFHGSRNNFDRFNPRFKHSGDGTGNFEGFYFIDNLKGAWWHCKNRLKANRGEAYIHICEVPDHFIEYNIEWPDSHYSSSIYGVKYIYADAISILESHEYSSLLEEAKGTIKYYRFASANNCLSGGIKSNLIATSTAHDSWQ
ncbi:hypothetical protein [Pleionea sediminis]|uniref:hypothetical protein n=1 Tax=Pleionea sediminis TaxID=2569479 RepID=UPI001186B714|nr:hypothetical protein [Pleionea sediminis]